MNGDTDTSDDRSASRDTPPDVDDVRRAVAAADGPAVTTGEVADRLDRPGDATRAALDDAAASGALRRRESDGVTLWWLPAGETEAGPPDAGAAFSDADPKPTDTDASADSDSFGRLAREERAAAGEAWDRRLGESDE